MNIRIPPHTNIATNQEKQFQKTNVKQTAKKSKLAIQPFPLKGLPPNSKFNDGNKTISVSCPACKEHIGTIPTNEQISISNDTEPVETFKASVSTFGCDWEMLANVLGQTGPNGKYFCPFCEVMLSDTKKGSPHSPIILQRYLAPGTSPERKFAIRTFENMREDAKKFKENGAKKESAKDFKNCENYPLIPATGEVLSDVSVMPLHISLGLGLQFLNIAENIAVSLDIDVRKENGLTSNGLIEAYNKEHSLVSEIADLTNQIQHTESEITTLEENRIDVKTSYPQHFEKQNGKSLPQNQEAKACRQQFSVLTKQLSENKSELKRQTKLKISKENELKELDKYISQIKGPFKTKFDNLMDSLNLKRQVYHSGALVANDIDRIYGNSGRKNLDKIADIFRPTTIQLLSGDNKDFGSHILRQKVFTLLFKFAQVYQLMMVSRVLCKHEVEILKLRCYSLGCWFPTSFPDETIKRKFHLLTYHVPEKASNSFTVGMFAENISESIHPIVNRLKRRYASVTNHAQQLSLICKDQWLASNPKVHDYRSSQKSRCSLKF